MEDIIYRALVVYLEWCVDKVTTLIPKMLVITKQYSTQSIIVNKAYEKWDKGMLLSHFDEMHCTVLQNCVPKHLALAECCEENGRHIDWLLGKMKYLRYLQRQHDDLHRCYQLAHRRTNILVVFISYCVKRGYDVPRHLTASSTL